MPPPLWTLTSRVSRRAAALADRHYSRRPSSRGHREFLPPCSCVVLVCPGAAWATIRQRPEFVRHAWPGAWVCSLFRREPECPHLASDLIRAAVAATRSVWGDPPPEGIITFVDPRKVTPKRDPGYCYLLAGWRLLPERTKGGLLVFQQPPSEMPAAAAPAGMQLALGMG